MTKDQLKCIHVYKGRLEKLSQGRFDRAAYDMVLVNVGRIRSDGEITSKALTNIGYERVMAFLEDRIANYDKSIGTKWREIEQRQGKFLTSRQEWQIREMSKQLAHLGQNYAVDGLARRLSNHRVAKLEELTSHEAIMVIEALKAVILRHPATTEAK